MSLQNINWRPIPLYTLLLMFAWPWLIKWEIVDNSGDTLYWFIAATYLNYLSFIFSIAYGQRMQAGGLAIYAEQYLANPHLCHRLAGV